jgi:peroxiredoxin family protein
MNRGVLLTIAGSPVLDHLEALEEKGVSVLSCGTCLDYYQVRDQLAVGAVTNMYSALEILTSTARNLTI